MAPLDWMIGFISRARRVQFRQTPRGRLLIQEPVARGIRGRKRTVRRAPFSLSHPLLLSNPRHPLYVMILGGEYLGRRAGPHLLGNRQERLSRYPTTATARFLAAGRVSQERGHPIAGLGPAKPARRPAKRTSYPLRRSGWSTTSSARALPCGEDQSSRFIGRHGAVSRKPGIMRRCLRCSVFALMHVRRQDRFPKTAPCGNASPLRPRP